MSDEQSPKGELVAPNAAGSQETPKRNKHLHIRDKIRAAVILERLERNALGELQPPMDKDQIRSAEIVLKKVIPDLAAIQLTGDPENPIELIHKVRREVVRPNA